MLVIQPDSSQVSTWLFCFPNEKKTKKNQLSSEEAKELSLASERFSDAPPAEPSTRTARTFTDPGSWEGTLGESQPGHELGGKVKGWKEKDGGSGEVKDEEEVCGR